MAGVHIRFESQYKIAKPKTCAEARLFTRETIFPLMSPLLLSRNICSGAPVNRTSNGKDHSLGSISSAGSGP
jgi:hypothetical protein